MPVRSDRMVSAHDYLVSPPADLPLRVNRGGAASLIEIDSVHRIYGTGPGACSALLGITAEIREGAFVALAGPSGSGKTTLLNLIGALDSPTSGSIRVRGRDLAGMSESAISRFRLHKLGFVFQDFNLVPVMTVAENIEFPMLFRHDLSPINRQRRVSNMLERVGLEEKRQRRPSQLSGGERQRVALARALAGEPEIVLADEPTAHLDQETGARAIALMRSWNRDYGTTFLYSTHDAGLVALADHILNLRGGRLQEDSA
jgi:putative ABC transport system ATP-binding protein